MRFKKQLLAGLFLCSTFVQAELKPMDEAALRDTYGQAMPVIEMSGQITYDAIVYTPADGGAKEVLLPGVASADGAVSTQNLDMSGQLFGLQSTGFFMDQMFSFLPIRVGAIDIDGDGTNDRGAAMFSFQPNVGLGTQFSPLDITSDQDTINIKDQMFISNQGILMLNAPLTGPDILTTSDGSTYQTVPVKLFE